METSGLQQPYCSANTIKTALVAEFELEFSDLSTLCIGETSGRNIFEGLGLRVPGGQTDGATGHDEIKEMVTEMAELFFSFLTGDQGWQFKTNTCKSFSSSLFYKFKVRSGLFYSQFVDVSSLPLFKLTSPNLRAFKVPQ